MSLNNKPRIMIVGSALPAPQSLETFYKNAFETLGHTVHQTCIAPNHGLIHRVRQRLGRLSHTGLPPMETGESVMQEAQRFKPDLTIVFRGEHLRPEPVEYLNKLSTLGCVNIYTDSPFVIPGNGAAKLMPSLQSYSCIYTFSKGLLPAFSQLGAKHVAWLPFGFDPGMHAKPQPKNTDWYTPVAYLGAWGPLQQAWLEPLASRGLKIYGPGWQHAQKGSCTRHAWQPGKGMGTEMCHAIQGADIVFNMVRAEHGCAHSMKTFEIPACGGFMLTNFTEEQAEFFTDGQHCVYFQTQNEMLAKLTYYMSHPEQRQRIAYEGRIEAIKHPYTLRATQILKDCAA